MRKLTEEWLTYNEACKDGIAFAKKHKLIGFPLDKVHLIESNHDLYVEWLKDSIQNIIQYDDNGRIVYLNLIGSLQKWYTYDSDGIQHGHELSHNGPEYWFTCNKNGKITHITNKLQYELTREYDENDNMLSETHNSGFFIKNTYNDNNKLIFTISSTNAWHKNIYDNNGNLIISKYSDGNIIRYTYDDNNNLLTTINPNCIIIKTHKYDENNNIIYTKYKTGEEIWYQYDDYNNIINEKFSSGIELTYTYDYYPDGQLKHFVSMYRDIFIPFFDKDER